MKRKAKKLETTKRSQSREVGSGELEQIRGGLCCASGCEPGSDGNCDPPAVGYGGWGGSGGDWGGAGVDGEHGR